MKILVCAKQVPNTNEIKTDPVTGTLIRDGVESILNPDDANALEEALRLRDRFPGSTVTVICMGPPQAKEMLVECVAMGADDAILISDRAVGGSDTWATSNAITAAIEKVKDFDIIFAGRQAIDGDTAQVGPQIAEKLHLPQVTYVKEFDIDETGSKVTVKRALEDGYEIIEVPVPCMLTCIKELNKPRYMNIGRIVDLCREEQPITVWNAADIEVDLATVGLKASPTKIFRSFTPKPKEPGIMLTGDSEEELAISLITNLKRKHVI